MDRATAILVTLVAYKVLLLGLGFWAQRRTTTTTDFYLGGRKLGPWVAAISASASSSSVWTLLGLSGFAYLKGISALWMIPACCGGFVLNWCFVAPRMLRERGDALTLPDWLAGPPGTPGRARFLATAAIVVLASFLVYVAAQFGGAGNTFEESFRGSPMQMSRTGAVVTGGTIVLVYTLLGGFWAVSLTDTLQGLMMASVSVVLPFAALIAIGGPGELADGLAQLDDPHYLSLTHSWEGPAGVGFVLGLLGIGLGYPGQPHVINRFMALSDQRSLRQGRAIALTWAFLTYGGMILLGLCARLLDLDLGEGEHEQAFFASTNELFPPIIAGVMVAAVLSAIMSTADSQLLVCASSVTEELGLAQRLSNRGRLLVSRLTVVVLSLLAIVLALTLDKTVFDNVLFAWSAVGAAFGPLLLIRLWRGPVAPGWAYAAMLTGFLLAAMAFALAKLSNDELTLKTGTSIEERVLPFLVAGLLAWLGTRPRRS